MWKGMDRIKDYIWCSLKVPEKKKKVRFRVSRSKLFEFVLNKLKKIDFHRQTVLLFTYSSIFSSLCAPAYCTYLLFMTLQRPRYDFESRCELKFSPEEGRILLLLLWIREVFILLKFIYRIVASRSTSWLVTTQIKNVRSLRYSGYMMSLSSESFYLHI